MFVPTDDAVKIYLTEVNKTLTGLTEAEAQNIVKIHLLEDTLTTASFKDGKLPISVFTIFHRYRIGRGLLGAINLDNTWENRG